MSDQVNDNRWSNVNKLHIFNISNTVSKKAYYELPE